MLYCAVIEKIVSARLWADCASTEIVGQGSWVGGCGGTRLIQQFVDYRMQLMLVQAETVTWRT